MVNLGDSLRANEPLRNMCLSRKRIPRSFAYTERVHVVNWSEPLK
jgi:hypothetical protein